MKASSRVLTPCDKDECELDEILESCRGCFPIEIVDRFSKEPKITKGVLGVSRTEDGKRVNMCVFKKGQKTYTVVVRFSFRYPTFEQLVQAAR